VSSYADRGQIEIGGLRNDGWPTLDAEEERVARFEAEGVADWLRHGHLAIGRQLAGDVHPSLLMLVVR
jgi:hypothetical protein